MGEAKLLTDLEETPAGTAASSVWPNVYANEQRDLPSSWAQTRERARERLQQAIAKERERTSHPSEIRNTAGLEGGSRTETEAIPTKVAMQVPQTSGGAHGAQPMQPATPHVRWELLASSRAPESAVKPEVLTHADSAARIAIQPEPAGEYGTLVSLGFGIPTEEPECPAWLARGLSALTPNPAPQAPGDTLQGARDRMTSRWFALKGTFEDASAAEPEVAAPTSQAPVLAVFSLAGGVGKTSIVATLGRVLSARGERVLLVETTAYGLLPFFFGSQDRRTGVLRTFSPPEASGNAPVQMVTIDADALEAEAGGRESLAARIAEYTQGVSRVIVDVATASAATARRVLRMSPMILVPVVPDMNSVVSTHSIDAFFERNRDTGGKAPEIYYVLNEFDPSLPLHLDVREVLREQLGYRLLPFALRRSPAASEALAEGMTVIDYAADSVLAEDFNGLAGWLKSVAAPAVTSRSKRWSEK
jgi:cellulose synthase operon protein YhjQ